MKTPHLIFILLAIFVGTLAALLAWTLIVKQVVSQQLAASTTTGTAGTINNIATVAGAFGL